MDINKVIRYWLECADEDYPRVLKQRITPPSLGGKAQWDKDYGGWEMARREA
jgi:hypothetical protein